MCIYKNSADLVLFTYTRGLRIAYTV